MDTLEAIRKRRTVRQYTGEPIPRQDLETIVDAGRLAASGVNLQPWQFIVVTDREMIARLRLDAEGMEKAGAIIAVVMDPSSRWWVEDAAAAVQNMLVAATALGYGGCWREGFTRRHEDEIKLMLGIPAERRLMTVVPFGVPVEWPVKEKKPLAEVIRWEKY